MCAVVLLQGTPFINKKNKEIYFYISEVVNATNGFDEEVMILYEDKVDNKYVRNKEEFFKKFKKKKQRACSVYKDNFCDCPKGQCNDVLY